MWWWNLREVDTTVRLLQWRWQEKEYSPEVVGDAVLEVDEVELLEVSPTTSCQLLEV